MSGVSRRWRLRMALPAVVVLVAIGFLAPSSPDDWSFGVGWGIAGVAGVILVAYAFLAIGESEDRDREESQRRRNRRR